ncbi:GGDEF domain-containing protein [Sulfurimonas sp.]|uniref:GGDEF domain-containing protein n=1 Tax=Sulfurimonas sp. TaxID=2022749 RepID=UPI003D14D234
MNSLYKTFTSNNDPLRTRQFILINGFFFIGIIAFIVFGFINFFVTQNYLVSLLDAIALMVFLLSFSDLKKTQHINKAATIGIALISIFMFTFAIINHNQSFGLIWSIFFPIFAMVMMGHKKGLIASLIYYIILYSILFYGLFYWENSSWDMLSLVRLVITSFVLMFAIFIMEYSVYKMEINLQNISITDQLTGLYNRREIDETMQKKYECFQRYEMCLSICIIDIDNFKQVNDTYGHATGDNVLVQLSEILKENTRKTDTVGRWGGEEFIVIMPHTDINNAFEHIKQIKQKINSFQFEEIGHLTCSFGMSEAEHREENVEQLFLKADKKLYEAKNSGKDKIVF